MEQLEQVIIRITDYLAAAVGRDETYLQLTAAIVLAAVAWLASLPLRRQGMKLFRETAHEPGSPLRRAAAKIGLLAFPLVSILLFSIGAEVSLRVFDDDWVLRVTLVIALLVLLNGLIRAFVTSKILARIFRWLGLPMVVLDQVGALEPIGAILEAVSLQAGNIQISIYDLIRFVLYGSLLVWFGRFATRSMREIIVNQDNLELRTQEVATKLFEGALFMVLFLILLQIIGVDLTALAVFGGAVGVGIGFGLQSIASNFISGIIILLDRSLSHGDYIELEDGRVGVVRELSLRSTTLETFDGKDIMVPNERFISQTFINWTHKDPLQRYRVDFPVAYGSDVRRVVELVKAAVAQHPQVIAGDRVPLEMCPDCEIHGFGDSGIDMFVEFWMEGIDDGKNRVGGDLLLTIHDTLRENGFEIPFPQREVRIRKPDRDDTAS